MAFVRASATWTALLFPLAVLFFPATASAQEFGRIAETETNVAYFFFAQPGQATVQVSVWGAPRPGIYEIPDGTDLDRLLTMAGGAPLSTRQSNQKPPRITIRLYRPSQSREEPLFEAPLEDMLLGTAATYPTLEDDDIVVLDVVQPAPRFGWRDVLSIVTTAASLALITLQILRFSNR
jgi:hypothetical protein